MTRSIVIHVERLAPAKPAVGAVCNGCGVCCLVEPCPVGILVSRRRAGACSALRWDVVALRYQCGALTVPRQVWHQVLPRYMQWMAGFLSFLLNWRGAVWIGAGVGCDCTLQVDRPSSLSAGAQSAHD